MTSLAFDNFDRRSARILKKSKLMKRGVVHSVRDDGLIVRRPRRTGGMGWRPILNVFLAVWAFKSVAVLSLGLTEYNLRTAALMDGSMVQQAAAVVLQADPVTVTVSQHLETLSKVVSQAALPSLF